MLKRGFEQVPESAKTGERFEIPKVKGHIQGSKTVVSNFFQIASAIQRDPQKLLKFILRELATPAETNGSQIIFGRKVSASRVNETVEKFAKLYVICKECGKPDTTIIKKNRVGFLHCNACGAEHPIKS